MRECSWADSLNSAVFFQRRVRESPARRREGMTFSAAFAQLARASKEPVSPTFAHSTLKAHPRAASYTSSALEMAPYLRGDYEPIAIHGIICINYLCHVKSTAEMSYF